MEIDHSGEYIYVAVDKRPNSYGRLQNKFHIIILQRPNLEFQSVTINKTLAKLHFMRQQNKYWSNELLPSVCTSEIMFMYKTHHNRDGISCTYFPNNCYFHKGVLRTCSLNMIWCICDYFLWS